MTYPFDFFTQYGQFYLSDKTSSLQTDSENFWTEQALEDNLAIEEGVIGIASEGGHGRVKGEIKILPEAGELDSTKGYDHIVEGTIAITSGIVQELNCPDSALQLEFELNPGFYRVRVYVIDFDAPEKEKYYGIYSIDIWPQAQSERKVLKEISIINKG